MYKFASQLNNANLILVRKQVGDGSCAALVVMRAPVRRYAQEHFKEVCPPPKPPRKSKFLLYAAGATLLTGAAVVYAKKSPDARNFLESNLPFANNFVAIVYQENQTYWEFLASNFNKYSTRLASFMFGKEGVSPLDFKQRSEQDIEKDAVKHFAPKEYELPPATFEPLYVEEMVLTTPEIEEASTLVQTDKCEPQAPPAVVITKEMVELEQMMHENTKSAIENYKRAMKLSEDYNATLYRVVEAHPEDLDKKFFASLKAARLERDATIKKATEARDKANHAIDSIDEMIKEGVAVPPENLAMTLRFLKKFRKDLKAAEDDFKVVLDKAVISDKYWDKVEAARVAYSEELQTLFPGVDLCARQLDIKGEDTDLLLLYTLKQIQFLQSELAEIQTVRELAINRAIECKDEKAIIEAKVEDLVKKERIQKELEFQKRSLIITAEAHRKMKEQLKRQYQTQQDVLADAIKRKEMEIMGKFDRVVSEQLEKDRVELKKQLAAMAGKMNAIEQTLKQRAKAEAEARRSQAMWAAAEALLAATRRPQFETKIENEIKALEKAGKGDKLVGTVLKTIPEEVRGQGIATELSLKDRFDLMEKTAMKVALIGREGASLPMYFLSWLQSKVLFQTFAEIPQEELDNQPMDFTNLDTFDIIQRARYFMDHGNLAAALRYVNLLQGAPRAAAQCWADAARRHLEIKQAAETVMAHASLSGMIYL